MRNAILIAVLAVTGFSSAALAEGKKIGVSWAQFQEERWKIDEAAMKAAIEAAGNEYISADAQSSAEKQLSDIDALISQGVDGAHHQRLGQGRDRPGHREGRGRGHSGRRL